MDALLNAALAGTSRAGGQLPPADTPADGLVAPLPDVSAERRILLAAGARAIYRRAGGESRSVAAPSAAPDDPAATCAPGAARLLARMLAGEHDELLPEAFDRLNRAGKRLPPALLPAALEAGSRKSDLRPALLLAIGERGRWLAAHNQPWRWATARPVAADGALSPDAETLWEEGPPAQRLAILRRVRAHDPAQGRAWLEAAWKGEKADFRAEAIKTLEVGLSAGDEPFLEAALDDRSQAVRPEAAKLLARLPGSAFAARLRGRADRILAFSPGLLAGGWRSAAKALISGASGGKLTVTPPETYDQGWARDGIAEKPPPGIGARAWWLQQLLALIPPSHWSGRFAAEPTTLIAAAEASEWAQPVLQGWGNAMLLHRDGAWAAALWHYWSWVRIERQHRPAVGQLLGEVATMLPQREAEMFVIDALARVDSLDDRLLPTIQRLPRPWSATFADAVVRHLQARIQEANAQVNAVSYGAAWLTALTDVASAIPPASFKDALALQALATNDASPEQVAWWQRRITDFADLVRTRQRLMEEIPL